VGGDVAGEQCGQCEGQVAGGLVEAHGQASAAGADQVDLHDDRGGPGQALADAEQDVGGHDDPPLGCPDEEQGDGYGDQPAGDEDGLAAVAFRPGAGQVVGERLGQAEREDVGQGRGVGVEAEHVGGQQRQDGAFLAEHPADQRVDGNEQRELGQIGAQP